MPLTYYFHCTVINTLIIYHIIKYYTIIRTLIEGGQWRNKITIYGNGLSVYVHIWQIRDVTVRLLSVCGYYYTNDNNNFNQNLHEPSRRFLSRSLLLKWLVYNFWPHANIKTINSRDKTIPTAIAVIIIVVLVLRRLTEIRRES